MNASEQAAKAVADLLTIAMIGIDPKQELALRMLFESAYLRGWMGALDELDGRMARKAEAVHG